MTTEQLEQILANASNHISPSRHGLQKVLQAISAPPHVTKQENYRYIYRSVVAGGRSFATHIHRYIMKLKIIGPALVAVAFIAIISINRYSRVAPTGTPDAIVNDEIIIATAEQKIADQEDSDVDFINAADNSIINIIKNTTDENEF